MPTLAPLELDQHCLFAGFLNEIPHFATADGQLHRLDGGHQTFAVHEHGMTCAKPIIGSTALLTGGEDGSVMLLNHLGEGDTVFEGTGQWVTALAGGPDGAIAAAIGKTVKTRLPKGKIHDIRHERTIEDIAFFSKGMRIAAAHYDGVSLSFPAIEGAPQKLEWPGAHLMVSVAPNNDYVVTAMQENALHGWRVADKKDLRMSGYPSKTKSLSWSVKAKFLATSGAPVAVLWPFTGKEGPMGKAPLEVGFREKTLVTYVACHPGEEVLAIGFEDGTILLCKFEDGREVLLRRGDGYAVTSMNWDKVGIRLAFGSEKGACGVIDIRG